MISKKDKNEDRRARHARVRKKLTGTAACPRFNVYRLSLIHIFGNVEHEIINVGKAGKTRHMGVRPTVRGSVMNPNDHPHGGGEGKSPVGHAGPFLTLLLMSWILP